MNQNDMPAPAVVDEEKAVIEEENAVIEYAVVENAVVEDAVIEYVPPSPPRPEPKPAKSAKAAPPRAVKPDPYAVGVRVLKMAPAWLLFTAVCCSGVVLALGWMRSGGGDAAAFTPAAKQNDARPARRAPAAEEAGAKAEADPPATTAPAAPVQKTTAANDAPAQASAQPAAQTPPAAAAPKVDEKPRVETPAQAPDAPGNFTAQVGSFNSQSEANARVSSLRAAGFEAHVVAAELPGRGTWYRVQVGRFADRGEASKQVAALRAKGAASSALVVPVQK